MAKKKIGPKKFRKYKDEESESPLQNCIVPYPLNYFPCLSVKFSLPMHIVIMKFALILLSIR